MNTNFGSIFVKSLIFTGVPGAAMIESKQPKGRIPRPGRNEEHKGGFSRMKTRTRSRLLALLLVLVMVMTLLPTAAFA
ncbi:MAG: hypothetical protein SPI26_00745, partial [Oscillospiraceae bacterium]|nr:hypothetical protein [Oscillospiraceae bacterium]